MMIEKKEEGIVEGLERAFMNFNAVEDRLVEAMRVLARSSDREWGWLNPGTLAMFRQYRPENGTVEVKALVRAELTRLEVTRAEEALGWIAEAVEPGLTRQIMGAALMQLALGDRARVEWPAVRGRLGEAGKAATTDQLRMRYNRAITDIAISQNARIS